MLLRPRDPHLRLFFFKLFGESSTAMFYKGIKLDKPQLAALRQARSMPSNWHSFDAVAETSDQWGVFRDGCFD